MRQIGLLFHKFYLLLDFLFLIASTLTEKTHLSKKIEDKHSSSFLFKNL